MVILRNNSSSSAMTTKRSTTTTTYSTTTGHHHTHHHHYHHMPSSNSECCSLSSCFFKSARSTKRSFGVVFLTFVLVSIKTFQAVVDHHVIQSLLSQSAILGIDTPIASSNSATAAAASTLTQRSLKGSVVQDQRRTDVLIPPEQPPVTTKGAEMVEPQSSPNVESSGSSTNEQASSDAVASPSSSSSFDATSNNDSVETKEHEPQSAPEEAPPQAVETNGAADTAQAESRGEQPESKADDDSALQSVYIYYTHQTPGTITTNFTESNKYVSWKGRGPLDLFAEDYFQNTNRYCLSIDEALTGIIGEAGTTAALALQSDTASSDTASPPATVHMSIEFECKELFYNSGYGTGNIITMLYGMRLSSLVRGHVSLHFVCTDADATKQDLILPWLTGYFAPRIASAETANPFADLTSTDVCGAYFTTKIVHMYRDMQYDLRRMAIGLVGVPHEQHPAAQWMAETYGKRSDKNHQEWTPQVPLKFKDNDQRTVDPVFAISSDSDAKSSDGSPTIQLDDAVIHFRCGDLMDSDHGEFAFLKFASYVHDIAPEARSIGIITQPFPKDKSVKASDINHYEQQARYSDASPKTQNRCQTVVLAMVDYIQERHPLARVSIHNGPSETIALAYARMIMANQTIVGISTFGVFPVLSTFGTGYLHQPQGPFVNGWMFSPVRIDELASNVHWIEDKEYIMVVDMKKLWETEGETGVVAWFRGEERVVAAAPQDNQGGEKQGEGSGSQTDAMVGSTADTKNDQQQEQPKPDATPAAEVQ